jgi:hypothetical protein
MIFMKTNSNSDNNKQCRGLLNKKRRIENTMLEFQIFWVLYIFTVIVPGLFMKGFEHQIMLNISFAGFLAVVVWFSGGIANIEEICRIDKMNMQGEDVEALILRTQEEILVAKKELWLAGFAPVTYPVICFRRIFKKLFGSNSSALA